MIPSLVAGEVRAAVLEYLTTAFALADDGAREALTGLLTDPGRGIFRGPYLRARTPFQPVDEGWESPLSWLPGGFRPYAHQAAAFAQLSSLGQEPSPVIVTTGTGSGKTESFLLPLLDHCRRHARTPGVKALLLYPMNALAADQARRITRFIHDEPALQGVTAGLYVGGPGDSDRMGSDTLITKRDVLRAQPPDILLTNYKMLDYLLLREADAPLWANAARTLRYLVLDEFHTYDGAQGTDVAMLLRRLGATLQAPAGGPPLGSVVPVATSATLGGSSLAAQEQLREFAGRVFGVPFSPESLIGEVRLPPAAVAEGGRVPTLAEISELGSSAPATEDDWEDLARLFTGVPDAKPSALGLALAAHPVTAAVAQALPHPLPIEDAVIAVARGVLPWAVERERNPEGLHQAVLLYLALLSRARDAEGRPLLHIEVQLWIRELHRMLRAVGDAPEFAWWSDVHDPEKVFLPAAYCRNCGRSGWAAVAGELSGPLRGDPEGVWRAGVRSRNSLRVLLTAQQSEAGVSWLDPATLDVSGTRTAGALPVLCTPDAEAAAREECPSCGRPDATRFLGSRSATLVSVSLTQLFGSAFVAQDEQRNLVFTDSVQDAAHRAAFVEGRAFQFNLRSLLARAVPPEGAPLASVAATLARNPSNAELYAIIPPDFSRRLGLSGDWLASAGRPTRNRLTRRLEFQAHLEFGLRSRLGRTLELTGTLTAEVAADLPGAASRAREIHANLPERGMGRPREALYQTWLLGILDRLRTSGGIRHRWLDAYAEQDGNNRWPIWGGRERGMPAFPRGAAAPTFFTSADRSDGFDSVSPRGEQDTWLTFWTRRCLGIDRREARALLREVFTALSAGEDPLFTRQTTRSGNTVYGLSPERIMLVPVADLDLATGRARLRCSVCRQSQPTSAERFLVRLGGPCPRFHCPGTLEPARFAPGDFYRQLYGSGMVRRIVARDHTSLLSDEGRKSLEQAFTRVPQGPLDPNVLACTPTLELGIDIGDLPGVTLASIPRSPANYVQRAGRAGRRDGNAFILAAARARPREQYFFTEPLHLIDGDVRPPGCYLDATELLGRQFFAFCLDRAATGELPLGTVMPPTMGALVRGGLDESGWMRRLLDAIAERHATLREDYIARFGDNLTEASRAHLRSFAEVGLREAVTAAFSDWTRRYDEITMRLVQLQETIAPLQRRGVNALEDGERDDLRRLRGEQKAQRAAAHELDYGDSIGGLVGLGLLPNYTLLDDSTTLDVSLWWVNENEGGEDYATEEITYQRGRMTALTELAPGQVFYANGQRIRIDAVDLGPRHAPLWREWRLCPGCGWGVVTAEPVPVCPRCGSTAVRDSGALHKMLELRRVSSVQSMDDAVIEDDAEEREEIYFRTVGTVDASPADVSGAWRLRDVAFGAEYLRSALVRRINLGPASRPGANVTIAGNDDVPAPGFRVCGHCGVVDGVQNNPRGDTRHRGWCATRHGGAEEWEERLFLHHDLRTQAVRILLPVSMLDVESRMTSLAGAIMLGLREDFGGDPQHLDRLTVVQPGMDGTRRYLVLHDVVPGGTGYLDRIGDPDRMKVILEHAQRVLRDCPCALDGLDACHRCLLGVVNSVEAGVVRRVTALQLVTEILANWEIAPTETVTRADLSGLAGSELEQRFRALLLAWAGGRATAYGAEVRLNLGDGISWRMRPQVPLGATCPDYLLTPTGDTRFPEVAVYLDGLAYHATVAHNRTADDAVKRGGVRDGGRLVWNLTWDDLTGFERYLERRSDDFRLLPQPVENAVRQLSGEVTGTDVPFGNPMRFLTEYLSNPGSPTWPAVALAAALSMFVPVTAVLRGTSSRVTRDTALDTITTLHRGQALAPVPAAPQAPYLLAVRASQGGCWIASVAEAEAARRNQTASTVVMLDDRPDRVEDPRHQQRWADWLHWANVLQFLNGDKRTANFVTTTTDWDAGLALPPVAGPIGATAPAASVAFTAGAAVQADATLPPDWERRRRVASDLAAASLIADLGRDGRVGVPDVGLDVGDDNQWMVELAWEDVRKRLAAVTDDDAQRDAWLTDRGWHVVHISDSDAFNQIVAYLLGGDR